MGEGTVPIQGPDALCRARPGVLCVCAHQVGDAALQVFEMYAQFLVYLLDKRGHVYDIQAVDRQDNSRALE